MGLLDIFKRDRNGATSAAAVASGEQAEQARTRAKRRLIGAVVLLGVGVIAFPLLFETQPRPIPVDIPIQIPSRENTAPLALPAPKPAVPTAAASAPVAAPAASTPAPSAMAPPAPVAAPPRAETPPVAPAPKPAPAPAPKPAAETPKPVAEAAGRFVVQIGAFAEAAAVREARAKADKLGLRSFTQVVATSSGQRTRVRLGPFASRDEADKAADKAKSAGLPAAVLAL